MSGGWNRRNNCRDSGRWQGPRHNQHQSFAPTSIGFLQAKAVSGRRSPQLPCRPWRGCPHPKHAADGRQRRQKVQQPVRHPLMVQSRRHGVSRQVPFPWLPAKGDGTARWRNALLTEDIAELCQIIMNHYGHHFADNVVHVLVRLSVVFCSTACAPRKVETTSTRLCSSLLRLRITRSCRSSVSLSRP